MMKNVFISIVVSCAIVLVSGLVFMYSGTMSGAPPYDIEADTEPGKDQFEWLFGWKRPDGPPKVGLQAGHWKNEELPPELDRLRGSTGSSWGDVSEWEVNLDIARRTGSILESHGVVVDILPATVPVRYWADVFVAIHADGNPDRRVNGFKAATPRRNIGRKSVTLLEQVTTAYGIETGLTNDPNVTRDMRGYYAFSWWRRLHAVHPMSAAIILETGFLTSFVDRRIIVTDPDRAARGLANGILNYLSSEGLIEAH